FDGFADFSHTGSWHPGEGRDGDGQLSPATGRSLTGTASGCEGITREDVDCDGHLDLISEDLNHNGVLDPGEDRDGDHRLDYIDEDRNHNGVLDPGEDTNGNGILDTFDPKLPNIRPHIEDKNNDYILNDRP